MRKLGIIIPTYNRCEFVYEGVKALLPQLLEYQNDVCLLITDNASSDKTENKIRPLSVQYPDIIRYVKQSKNIGPHANFYFGVREVDSEYTFLLGDDDMVSPHFVSVLLDLINKYPGIGAIHFNHIQISPDHTIIRLFQKNIQVNSLVVIYQNGKDFIKSHLVSPSFMSSVVFRKECMLDGIKNYYFEDCYGYDWLLCLYYGIMNFSCIYYSMPLVVQRSGGQYENYARNTILGQQNLFNYLSPHIDGIDLYWKSCVAAETYTDVFSVMSSVINYHVYYKKYYSELKACLINNKHIALLWIAVYLPPFVSRKVFWWWWHIKRVTQKIKKYGNKKEGVD